MSSVEFCLQESVSHARTLPISKAITYLTGLLVLTDGTCETREIRAALNHLQDSDNQLELIASGQLKFEMPAAPAKGRK